MKNEQAVPPALPDLPLPMIIQMLQSKVGAFILVADVGGQLIVSGYGGAAANIYMLEVARVKVMQEAMAPKTRIALPDGH